MESYYLWMLWQAEVSPLFKIGIWSRDSDSLSHLMNFITHFLQCWFICVFLNQVGWGRADLDWRSPEQTEEPRRHHYRVWRLGLLHSGTAGADLLVCWACLVAYLHLLKSMKCSKDTEIFAFVPGKEPLVKVFNLLDKAGCYQISLSVMDLKAERAVWSILFCTCVKQHSVTVRGCFESSEFL